MALILKNFSGLNPIQQKLVGHIAPAPVATTTTSTARPAVASAGQRRPDMSSLAPAASGGAVSSYLAGGGGGGVASLAPIGPTAEQVAPLLASLNTLDGVLANKDAQAQAEYDKAITGYNEQDALDKGAYEKNVFGNESTFTGNNQKALLNAANASTGLRGVLASMHALGGSGLNVVKRLVGLAANDDTGASRQNFETNAGNLTTAWSNAERQQRQRREDAVATRDNNKQNNKAQVLTSRQGILQQLANMYDPTMAEGKTYASKAAALAPDIAATTRATVAPYAAASSSYSPAALQSYLAGTQKLNVSTTAAGPEGPAVNSPAYGKQKEDKLLGVA